jgi:hypothetical protein
MIVVNFATRQYRAGQKRLQESLGDVPNLMFTEYSQIGSPTHQDSPYEFKIHAIERGFEKDNIVLWADASMYLMGDISRIEKIIQEDGYFIEEAGHYVNDWCNQHTRQYFQLQPEENYTMFSAGLLGLDKTSPIAMSFFSQWKASAKAGCFKGDWSNHRHDMTCGSIIAQRIGLKYQRGGSHMAYIGEVFGEPEPGAVFHLKGIV